MKKVKSNISMVLGQGWIQDSQKGEGAQIQYNEHGNCVRSTYSGMQSMPNLGGLGACPPENFEKLNPLRLNLRAFLMVAITRQHAYCKTINVY